MLAVAATTSSSMVMVESSRLGDGKKSKVKLGVDPTRADDSAIPPIPTLGGNQTKMEPGSNRFSGNTSVKAIVGGQESDVGDFPYFGE